MRWIAEKLADGDVANDLDMEETVVPESRREQVLHGAESAESAGARLKSKLQGSKSRPKERLSAVLGNVQT